MHTSRLTPFSVPFLLTFLFLSSSIWERRSLSKGKDTRPAQTTLDPSPTGGLTEIKAPVSSPALGSLTATCVRYCMKNFTGSTSPTGWSSSWQWQFTGVWTAAHHRICRTTASQSPVLTLGGICVPPTVNCLQCLVTGSTLRPTAVGFFRLRAPQSGTLSRISSGTRPSIRTVSDGFLKRTCSLDTSAFSALEVLTTTALYKFTYLLTYLLPYHGVKGALKRSYWQWKAV